MKRSLIEGKACDLFWGESCIQKSAFCFDRFGWANVYTLSKKNQKIQVSFMNILIGVQMVETTKF